MWALGGLMGGGRRWYKVRVAPSYGLMDDVHPCLVGPGDPHRIWIDWDAAYEAHSEAWGRHARVEREVARRENAWSTRSSAMTRSPGAEGWRARACGAHPP